MALAVYQVERERERCGPVGKMVGMIVAQVFYHFLFLRFFFLGLFFFLGGFVLICLCRLGYVVCMVNLVYSAYGQERWRERERVPACV